MVSVLILTKNEALDLPGALSSVSGINGNQTDDIHVLDSFSSDATPAIVVRAGVHLHQRAFDNYANQRNFGLTLPFRYPWLLLLDADERVSPELSREILQQATLAGSHVSGFQVRRRDFLFNTWLKHAQMSPYYIRMVRAERSRYARAINEVIEVDGAILELAAPLDHFPFSKGISHWIDRHNKYSSMEAELIFKEQGFQNPRFRTAFFGTDFHIRRVHQKALFYRMPGRPFIKFFYMMFLRCAFLDGTAGVIYATLASFYEYLIVLKTRELQLADKAQASGDTAVAS